MSNTYEMMFILRPDLTHDQVNKQLHKYRDLLKQNGAEKVSIEIWGKRRLAYQILKFQDGIYVLTHYTGDGSQVAIIERDMRLSETVIRYLTMKVDKNFEFEEKDIPELQAIPVTTPVGAPIPQAEAKVEIKTEAPMVEESTPKDDLPGEEVQTKEIIELEA
jgi:small subunit ribosomal protein S6